VEIAQLAHAADECILCHEGVATHSSQMTLGRTYYYLLMVPAGKYKVQNNSVYKFHYTNVKVPHHLIENVSAMQSVQSLRQTLTLQKSAGKRKVGLTVHPSLNSIPVS